VLAAALDRPRMLNRLVEVAAPRVGRRGCLLIVGVEGSAARADVESRLVFAELERAGGKDLGEEPGQRWLARRYAVSYNLSKMYDAGAFVDTMEVASTWERLIDLYDGVRHAIGKHAFVMAHFSHAGRRRRRSTTPSGATAWARPAAPAAPSRTTTASA